MRYLIEPRRTVMRVRTTVSLRSRFGLALLLIVGLVRAQTPLEVLRKTGETYRNARTFSLAGVDTLEQITSGNKRVTSRPFRAWRRDAAMRVDFTDGGLRLTDGRTEWNYYPQSRQYAKKSVPWDRRGLRVFHEFFYNYDGIADFVNRAEFIAPPGKDGFLLEVTYELPGGIASESIKNYWIDPGFTVRRETAYPRALESRARLVRTITFEKTAFNVPMDPALFSFPPPDEPRAGGKAPDFTLPDLRGAVVSLHDFTGRVVMLYFWATWCAVCRQEMPKLEQLARDYQDRGLVLVGINDEEPEIALAYLKNKGSSLRSLVDRWQDVYKKYNVAGIPAVILIGRDGRIVSDLQAAGIE